MRGVCPTGAQVRFSGEMSENPFSSSRIKVASNSNHFFYPWPRLVRPVGDGVIVALHPGALWLLAAPTHPAQQVPDAGRVIAHAKSIVDHAPDPIQGPVIFGIAMGIRPTQQLPREL